jgi:hypothetical protein
MVLAVKRLVVTKTAYQAASLARMLCWRDRAKLFQTQLHILGMIVLTIS